jgi:hypothetical protein
MAFSVVPGDAPAVGLAAARAVGLLLARPGLGILVACFLGEFCNGSTSAFQRLDAFLRY